MIRPSKIGDPPVLSILETKWTGTEWEMNGMFSDPDGEYVTFTMYIDGANIGTVQSFGNCMVCWTHRLQHCLTSASTRFPFVDVMHQECVQLLKVASTRP